MQQPVQAARTVVELAVSRICTRLPSGYTVIFRRVEKTLKRVDGGQNVADTGTKDADDKSMLRLCGEMGIVKMTGRSELPLRVSG